MTHTHTHTHTGTLQGVVSTESWEGVQADWKKGKSGRADASFL